MVGIDPSRIVFGAVVALTLLLSRKGRADTRVNGMTYTLSCHKKFKYNTLFLALNPLQLGVGYYDENA